MDIKRFLDIEQKYDLYNKAVCGVNYWIYNRFAIWNFSIYSDLSGLNTSYKKNKIAWKNVAQIFLYYFRHPSFPKDTDVLFLNHERRAKNGSFYDCQYTEKLNKIFSKSVTLEEPFYNSHFRPTNTPNLIYTDRISINASIVWRVYKIFRKKTLKRIIDELRCQLKGAIAELKLSYNWNVNEEELYFSIASTIIRYRCLYKSYYRLLAKIKPKVIVEVVHYAFSKMLINEIAKEMGIPTLELQHGTIHREHIPYQYRIDGCVKQFPDKLLLFSEFWRSNIHAPILNKNIISVGYPTYDEKLAHYNLEERSHSGYTILFISQGTVGSYLSELAYKLSGKLPCDDFRIIYKLHPSEFSNWRRDYPYLQNVKFEVISDNQESIYKYFNESDMQIGVYSTAIYEGLGFHLKTLILRVGNYEIMEDLVRKGYAYFIDNENDILKCLKEDNISLIDMDEFWKPNSLENIINEINLYL